MLWKGLNRRVDSADISPDESPDCKNCFHYHDKLGLLGPRRGKTFFNSTGYADDVLGVVVFGQQNGSRYLVVANDDGELNQIDAPQDTQAVALPGTQKRKFFLATPLAVTVASASTTGSASSSFEGAETLEAFTTKNVVVPTAYTVVATASGGDSVISYTVTLDFLDALAVSLLTVTPYAATSIKTSQTFTPDVDGYQVNINKSIASDCTSMKMTVTVTPSTATTWSVAVSSIPYIEIR